MGRVTTIGGNAGYPQSFTYNDFGDMETLATSGTQPATTTWHHDPATGRVVKKEYTDNSETLYAYTPGGRLAQRQWERGVTSTWTYDDATGDLESITHSDDTFDVAYAGHDIFGRPSTVTETRNGVPATTTFAYQPLSGAVSTAYATNHPVLPNLLVIAHDDDTRGRPTGHAAKQGSATVHSWTHAYDSHGRLGAVTGHNLNATLGYYPGTGLLKSQTTTSGTNTILTRTTNLDLLGRTYGVIQTAPDPDAGNTPRIVTALSHTHDSRHRRDSARREDGTRWTYGYNDRSEVTAAAKRLANSDLVPGLEFGYSYDGMGNRLQATRGNPALTAGYTPDAMNRYETITTPGGDDILVRSDAPVTITADAQPTTQTTAGNFHNGRAAIDNDPDGAWTEINVSATGFNHTGHRWTPPATVAPEYDDDGNLLNDGRWTYTWDAMNRLVALAPTANALTAGVPDETITYTYDHLSRRIGKKVVTTTGGTTTTKETCYLYDNWNVVAEFTVENGQLVPTATYLWSQDLSGSLQGAGGVGGLHSVNLLSSVSGSSVFLPSYDANGNIIAWTDTTGRLAQRQDYDPFGNLVVLERHSISAETSGLLTYGFSTKPLEAESGFHYYGYRFYDGWNGRWINRDPIGVLGGTNVYGMTTNTPINLVDTAGLSSATLHLAGFVYESAKMGDVESLEQVEISIPQPGGGVIKGTTPKLDDKGNQIFRSRWIDKRPAQVEALRETLRKCPKVLAEGGLKNEAEEFPFVEVVDTDVGGHFDDIQHLGTPFIRTKHNEKSIGDRLNSRFQGISNPKAIRVSYLATRDLLWENDNGTRQGPVRGMVIRDSKGSPTILMDLRLVAKYTLAHEIGHYIDWKDATGDVHYTGKDKFNLMNGPSPPANASPDCQWCQKIRPFLSL